jgi:hypothetical protein
MANGGSPVFPIGQGHLGSVQANQGNVGCENKGARPPTLTS